jgi:hypothetical protein
MNGWQLTALIVGTLVSVMGIAAPGLGKILPCHPFYPVLKLGFDTVHARVWAQNPTFMRLIVGFAFVASGLGMLVGMYMELHGFCGYYLQIGHLAEALMLCAPIGVIVVCFIAFYHDVTLGVPGPTFVLGILWAVVLVSRLMFKPFDSLPEMYRMLVYGWVGLLAVTTTIMGILKALKGAKYDDVKAELEVVKAMMDGKKSDEEKPLAQDAPPA